MAQGSVSSVELAVPQGAATGARDGTTALRVQATDRSGFVRALPRLASEHGIRLYEVTPADESLESVFSYLVER